MINAVTVHVDFPSFQRAANSNAPELSVPKKVFIYEDRLKGQRVPLFEQESGSFLYFGCWAGWRDSFLAEST